MNRSNHVHSTVHVLHRFILLAALCNSIKNKLYSNYWQRVLVATLPIFVLVWIRKLSQKMSTYINFAFIDDETNTIRLEKAKKWICGYGQSYRYQVLICSIKLILWHKKLSSCARKPALQFIKVSRSRNKIFKPELFPKTNETHSG